jgi:hypothetical protein
MEKILLGKQSKRLIKRSFHKMIGMASVIALTVSLNSCASTPLVYNIKSKSELKGGKKVLAGRFACFDNEAPVHCLKSGFLIYFNKEGEAEAKVFRPDDAGYVYIAVTEGYYNIATIDKGIKGEKSFIFDLDRFPVVLVRSEDSVLNFGTFEVHFSQGNASKATPPQRDAGRAQLRVNHIPNYDVTRSEIASRLGKISGPINDGAVQFLPRARR